MKIFKVLVILSVLLGITSMAQAKGYSEKKLAQIIDKINEDLGTLDETQLDKKYTSLISDTLKKAPKLAKELELSKDKSTRENLQSIVENEYKLDKRDDSDLSFWEKIAEKIYEIGFFIVLFFTNIC